MLLNADARNVLPMLPSDHFDCICTDPPYPTISGGSGQVKNHQRPTGVLAANDGKMFDHNSIKPEEYLPDLFRVLRPGGHIYLMTNFLNLFRFRDAMVEAGFVLHNLLVWEKNNVVVNRWYGKNCEYTLFGRKGPARQINDCGSKTVHQFDNILGNKTHPTEKPVDLMRFYVGNSAMPGQKVLDPFMGTGSTGVAAAKLSIDFTGLEVDKKHFDVAVDRIGHDPLSKTDETNHTEGTTT